MAENPYQHGTPISYSGRFAGRGEAFAFVQAHLVGGHQKHALVILGASQIGKSSFLRSLPQHLDQRYVPVRLALRAGTVAGESAWLNALAETIPQALAALDIQSARLPELPGETAALREALLGDYLADGLKALRRHRYLLLLIDNADRLLTAVQNHSLPRDTFKFIAQLLEAHPNLDIVMAFDSRYEPDLLTIGPPIEPALIHRLRGLTREEIAMLITDPVKETMTYTPEALEAIGELTAGHPYLAQLIAWVLFDRSGQRGHQEPITVADVEAVIEPVMAMGRDSLAAVWQNATPQEQLVLTAISTISRDEPPEPVPFDDISAWLIAADRGLDPRTVNATWRRLEYEGVLRLSADGRLVIEGGLQRRWLREHVMLPDVGERATPWRRVLVLAAAAVIALAVLLAILGSLPPPGVSRGSGGDATITLDQDLQATTDSYNATQTAIVR